MNRSLRDLSLLKFSTVQVLWSVRKAVLKNQFFKKIAFCRLIISEDTGPFRAGFSQFDSNWPRLQLHKKISVGSLETADVRTEVVFRRVFDVVHIGA